MKPVQKLVSAFYHYAYILTGLSFFLLGDSTSFQNYRKTKPVLHQLKRLHSLQQPKSGPAPPALKLKEVAAIKGHTHRPGCTDQLLTQMPTATSRAGF